MKKMRVCIIKDTSKPMRGLHGLQTAFRGMPNVEVTGFYDSNSDNIESRMEYVGAKIHYTDMETMFQTERPDIVILTSRHSADHLEQVRMAAKYNCNIYCEKALVCDLNDGDEILKIVKESGIKLCMAHPCRYAEPYLTMAKLIRTGAIGDIVSFVARGKCDQRGGGEDMFVLGYHMFDWLLDLFGTPESIYAEITKDGKLATKEDILTTDVMNFKASPSEPIGPILGDHIYAMFRFANGIFGSFESRKDLYDVKNGNSWMGLTVTGTKGSLSVRFEDSFERKLYICREAVPPESEANFVEFPIYDNRKVPGAAELDSSICCFKDSPTVRNFVESNRFAVWDLMNCIGTDKQPKSNAENAVGVQEIIQAIYLAHFTGAKVTLPLENRKHPLI